MASNPTYTVKPGDTLGKIAKAHSTTVAVLKALNAIADANKIGVGQTIKLPAAGAAPVAPAPAGQAGSHKVKPGETLSAIAKRHGVTVDAIVQANGIADPDRISPGQTLVIPGGASAAATPAAAASPKPSAKPIATGKIDTPLPASGPGFVTYNRENHGADQFGIAGFVDAIVALAAAWAGESATPVSYGDMSRKGGGRFPPHAGHTKGNEVDIRPFRKDGANLPVTIHDAAYDGKTTRRFLALLRQRHPKAVVLFNDPASVAAGLSKAFKGHHNHAHIRLL